jgi:radical SAM protein with 4Fe4S-binding SPASM domain
MRLKHTSHGSIMRNYVRSFMIYRIARVALTFLFKLKNLWPQWAQPSAETFPKTAPFYPLGLGFEVTNLCNANCVFCAYQYRQRPVSYMSFDTFMKSIDEYVGMEKEPMGVALTPTVGDPIIDRDLSNKIAYAHSYSQIKNIHLTTNAILLTREVFENLVGNGLNMITVSMSGFHPDEYARIYRNHNYQTVLRNLRDISQSSLFKSCHVEIGLRTSSLVPWLRPEYWEFVGLGFKMTRTLFFDTWSGRIKQSDLPGALMVRPEVEHKQIPCSVLYQAPIVLSDGTVTACGCRDLEGTSELRLGNVKEQPLPEILSAQKMEKLRQRFIENNLPDVCRDCRHYRPMRRQRHRERMSQISLDEITSDAVLASESEGKGC